MTICYTLIILRLRKTRLRRNSCTSEEATRSTRSLADVPKKQDEKRRKRKRSAATIKAERNRTRVNIMCGALVASFLVCWLPYHSIHMAKMNGIRGSTEFCMTLASFSSVFAYLNSALNPYLYNFIGTSFSRRMRSAARSVRRSTSRRRSSTFSSSGVGVRYHARGQGDRNTSSTGTFMTRIYKRRAERINQPESSSENARMTEDIRQLDVRECSFELDSMPPNPGQNMDEE